MPLLAPLPSTPQNFIKFPEPLQWGGSTHEPVGTFPIQVTSFHLAPKDSGLSQCKVHFKEPPNLNSSPLSRSPTSKFLLRLKADFTVSPSKIKHYVFSSCSGSEWENKEIFQCTAETERARIEFSASSKYPEDDFIFDVTLTASFIASSEVLQGFQPVVYCRASQTFCRTHVETSMTPCLFSVNAGKISITWTWD